mmetsp:Transcript_20035/g.32364  ORF Transcript_20035/g.32364 Transcript_20035/m.32364 type:complete len:142 (-) Transcript_20035:250-675(-)
MNQDSFLKATSMMTASTCSNTTTVPSSPQHCNSNSGHHQYFLGDDSSPTTVFASSFDSMACDEHKDLEHQMSRISLSRSDSQEDTSYDMELMTSYSFSYLAVPAPPPQIRRTTAIPPRSPSRSSSSSSRPSDPVARFLLSK